MMQTLLNKARSCLILLMALGTTTLYSQEKYAVTGTVTDEENKPMVGVTVYIKGTPTATTTNQLGTYKIMAPANGTINFSFVGYKSREYAINSRKEISVRMEPSSIALDDVVVVGYGVQRKIDMTGSITSLSAAELNEMPVSNVLEALSGKVAGMQIINDSEPGSASTVRIRGVGTYNQAAPICVIDGQFFEVSELSTLNSNDIESMSILKDASATAIYGSRGANGVIIVTTRQGSGEKGKVRVNANAWFSLSEMERKLSMADKSQWQQLENLSFLADNWNDPTAVNRIPNSDWRTAGKGTDWQDLISRKAFTHNYNLSISGTTEKMDYFFSTGLLDQQGVIQHSDYNRFTAKMNVGFRPVKWFKTGVNATFLYDNQVAVDRDILTKAGRRLANASVYNNAEEGGESENDFNGGDSNPYALLHFTHDRYNKSWRYMTQIYAEVSFLKNLVLRSTIGLTNNSREAKSFLPAFMEDVPNTTSGYKVSRFQHNTSLNNSWLQENTLTYNLNRKKHRLNAMVGFTLQSDKSQFNNLSATDLPWSAWKNRNLWYVGQGQNVTGADGGSDKSYVSFLARIGYTFKDRYIITLTGRADGSSAYPTDNQFGYFPAIGLGWNISQENFLKNVKWLDYLKLRASYGIVGNDRGVSSAQMLYADAVNVVMGSANDIFTSNALRLMIDNSLTWEEARTFNVGFDAAILKNRLDVTFEYYNKITSNVMMPLNIPPSNMKVTSNIGKVRNRGFELTVKYSPKLGAVNTLFQLTATTINNKVIKINENIGPISNMPNQTMEGYPIGGLWGYETIGVFQNDKQLVQMPKVDGTRVGDLMYRDRNGDGLLDASDYFYMGSYLPKAMFGFRGSATWKGITLGVELNSSLGHKSFNKRIQNRQTYLNAMTGLLNAWTGEGTTNEHPRVFSWSDSSNTTSDYFIENDDYLSISNVQLAYVFPAKLLSRFNIKNLRVYITGTNLYTWTEMTGYRPDVMPRGNNANLGGLDDFGLYPNNRTYTAGISFNF